MTRDARSRYCRFVMSAASGGGPKTQTVHTPMSADDVVAIARR